MSLTSDLTLKEKEVFDELKKRIYSEVPDHLKNDVFLYLRFLRARDFNVNLAEDMLRNHLTWRKANHIDTILTDFAPEKNGQIDCDALNSHPNGITESKSRIGVVTKYLPLTRIGFDKEGAPIRYFAFGNMDSKDFICGIPYNVHVYVTYVYCKELYICLKKGILKSVKRNECIKAVIQCFEEDVVVMKEQTAKLGKPIEQWVYIFNFEGYSFAKATHKPTLETLIALFMVYEANYPERLKAAYIINASVYFSIAFAIIKPLLSGATLKKITIYGKDGWQEVLQRDVDLDALPAFLGGNRKDPDGNPLCKTIVKHGSLVPEEYYITKGTNRLSQQPGVKKLVVNRMSKVHVILNVTEPGSLIEWEFETESKDIGFGLFYKINEYNDSEKKELVPKQRIDTHLASETGMYQCEKPGTYVLVFDNSYSWIHQKELYCKAVVVTPKGERVTVLN